MLTPLDIENKKFSKQIMNGYNVEEVDDFLDEIGVDFAKKCKYCLSSSLGFLFRSSFNSNSLASFLV